MTSIVTKTGDGGTTGLLGGSRVSKASPRLHAYGTVDELNAILGLALTEKDIHDLLRNHLNALQHTLFRLGADLSAPGSLSIERMTKEDVMSLEEWIAILEHPLPHLQNFIVPGGSRGASLLHHARTVCRRAERWTVTISEEEKINPHITIFLNRLSDYLFLAARTANAALGNAEKTVTRNDAR